MKRWLAVLVALGACGDDPVCKEPAQLTTFPHLGPGHNQFTPVTTLPAMVAGGTVSVPLFCDTLVGECEGMTCFLAEFDLPYDVTTRSGAVVFDKREPDNQWVFRADGAGTGAVAIVHPNGGAAYAEIATRAEELDHLAVGRPSGEAEPAGFDIVSSTQQDPFFAVYLESAADERLLDTSLVMQLPPGVVQSGLDAVSFEGVPSGSYPISVQSGGKAVSATVEIANEADAIELETAPATIPHNPIVPGMQEYVCFVAKNRGRVVSGLRWQHLIDGMPPMLSYTQRCVLAATDQPTGSPVTFTATAGGMSLTIQIPAR